MEKIQRLEELSDRVRKGEPILLGEALEVIQYQRMLKSNKISLKNKIINFFKLK